MHKEHAKDGLAVITVNLDDPGDKETRAKVIAFLKDKKAAFTNLALAEKEEVGEWVAGLKIDGIPVTDVYNRAGKLEKRIEGLDTEELDELVGKLLKK